MAIESKFESMQGQSWNRILFLGVFFSLLIGIQVGVAQTDSIAPLTKITIDESDYDFGHVEAGAIVEHTWTFHNAGEHDLILYGVKPSCGCTTIDWPRNPIPPGGNGEIKARLNTLGKEGDVVKYITITLNSAEQLERVYFRGEVLPAPAKKKRKRDKH